MVLFSPMERETLEADLLIVGAGPSGLACALRLAQLNAVAGNPLNLENIVVMEKGREAGAHMLSGAVCDPRSLRELVPDFATEAPGVFDTPVEHDAVYFFTEGGQWKTPIVPPPFHNHGNYIVSLNKLVKWLAGKVEASGITIFTETSGMEVLLEDGRVAGVRTGDKGVNKEGHPEENYQPGADIRAKLTVFAEGPRGSLAKQLITKMRLDQGRNPQTYAIGVKELWEVPEGRMPAGHVIHAAGWPLDSTMYGGAWIYGMRNRLVSLGLVMGLDYANPLFDPHNAFQRWKTHPFVRQILDGGKMVKYGAKTIAEGGYFSMPRLVTDGAMIVGESGGFLNSQRLKGIHLSMKSGMLAAETAFEALRKDHTSTAVLDAYPRAFEASWAKDELWKVRNFHQGFEHGMLAGMIHAGLQEFTGGRGLHARYPAEAGHRRMKKLTQTHFAPLVRVAADGKLTFDKVTDVYHSATKHTEDQPSHLRIADTDICNNRCITEFGNPCQYFCPAAVYEMEERSGKLEIKLNPSNCVHCKTCDIMDPYEIITWVCPEGGGGPNYENL
jgi:electron-transferring-flavoprotein dehydrogenase